MTAPLSKAETAKLGEDFSCSLDQSITVNQLPATHEKELIKIGLELCKSIAKFTHKKLPAGLLEVEDLMQYGCLGLLDCIAKFDPSLGIKFTTFIQPRIAGAMVDGIRSESINPRFVTSVRKDLAETFNALDESSEHLSKKGFEVAGLGIDKDQISELMKENELIVPASLEKTLFTASDTGKVTEKKETVSDERFHTPQRSIEDHDFLKMALKGLSKTERLIVIEYFYLGNPMIEVAHNLGYSESRISQTLSKLLLRIADNLRRYYGEVSLGPLRPDLDSVSRIGTRSSETITVGAGNSAAGSQLEALTFDYSD